MKDTFSPYDAYGDKEKQQYEEMRADIAKALEPHKEVPQIIQDIVMTLAYAESCGYDNYDNICDYYHDEEEIDIRKVFDKLHSA